jgi:DNA repair photolyase
VEAGRPIVLGAACDPYGGDAAHRSRSRELLAACRDLEGAELHLTTASPLILVDLDLLVELDQASSLTVEMVVPTAHPELSRRLEPGAAAPAERLSALGEIAAEGVVTHLRIAPLLPGITDSEAALRPLLDAAAAAGTVDVEASPLRLLWRTRRRFFAWLEREFPELLPRYRHLYRWRRTLPAAVREEILTPFHQLRLAHGFPQPHAGRG